MYFTSTRSLLVVATIGHVIIGPVVALVGYLPPLPRPVHKGPILQPAMQGNFADPAIIVVDGVTYTVATTTSGVNVPVASEQHGQGMQMIMDGDHPLDLMPTLPKWSSGSIWAPEIIQLADSTFVLYFSAAPLAPNSQYHCVGAATSKNVTGPYSPVDTPFACPLDQGGAIDPSGFTDTDGTVYVVYKVDGNSLGGGGPCGNGNGKHSTPLMLQQVASDGTTPVGDAVQLLDRQSHDGPLIEAPSLVKSKSGTYVLFFSSNCYNGPLYDTSYATSPNLKGPYTKTNNPLLLPGYFGLNSPGGTSVTPDGSTIVFHADKVYSNAGVRQMYMNSIEITGTTVNLISTSTLPEGPVGSVLTWT